MNQTWKNDKEINFVPDFGLFGQNPPPPPNFPLFFFFLWGGGGVTSTSNQVLFQALILCNLKENLYTKLETMEIN